jgi:hypothetical protein
VAVHVDVADGLGVLVGVGVTVAGGATRESRGQVQLIVAIVITMAMTRTADLTLVWLTVLSLTVWSLPFDPTPTC